MTDLYFPQAKTLRDLLQQLGNVAATNPKMLDQPVQVHVSHEHDENFLTPQVRVSYDHGHVILET